jgi:hypothetical protein
MCVFNAPLIGTFVAMFHCIAKRVRRSCVLLVSQYDIVYLCVCMYVCVCVCVCCCCCWCVYFLCVYWCILPVCSCYLLPTL